MRVTEFRWWSREKPRRVPGGYAAFMKECIHIR